MSAHLISILVLVGVFFLGTVRSVNLGVLALVGAFAVGSWVFGAKTSEVLAGFPADLFVILVGVTYLFAIAKRNGTVDWLVGGSVRAVRGRVAALPWVMFVLSGVLVALGALSPAAVAIIAPIGMAFAARYRINPMLMGLMVIHGSAAGNFSPLGVLGVITNGIVDRSDLPASPIGIFVANLIFNVALGVVIYIAFGGLRLLRSGARCTDHTETDPDDVPAEGGGGAAVAVKSLAAVVPRAERRERVATAVGLAVLAIGALVFDLDIGLTAMTVVGVLAVMSPQTAKAAVADISWGVVLLIWDRDVRRLPGISRDGGLHQPRCLGVLAVLALWSCCSSARWCRHSRRRPASSALVPLAVPLLAAGELGAIAWSRHCCIHGISCLRPFSTNGALVVANAPHGREPAVYRGLMMWGFGLVALTPLITWAIFVLPGW